MPTIVLVVRVAAKAELWRARAAIDVGFCTESWPKWTDIGRRLHSATRAFNFVPATWHEFAKSKQSSKQSEDASCNAMSCVDLGTKGELWS